MRLSEFMDNVQRYSTKVVPENGVGVSPRPLVQPPMQRANVRYTSMLGQQTYSGKLDFQWPAQDDLTTTINEL